MVLPKHWFLLKMDTVKTQIRNKAPMRTPLHGMDLILQTMDTETKKEKFDQRYSLGRCMNRILYSKSKK